MLIKPHKLTHRSSGIVSTINVQNDRQVNEVMLYIIFNHGLRYDPVKDSYHQDMEGDGVVCSAVDILPTEFAKEVPFIKAFCSVIVIIFRK